MPLKHPLNAKGFVAKLTLFHTQSAWESRVKMVQVVRLTAYIL